MNKCCGLMGLVFGHNFKPRYDETQTYHKDSPKHLEAALARITGLKVVTLSEDVDALRTITDGFRGLDDLDTYYVQDVCTRCGESRLREPDPVDDMDPGALLEVALANMNGVSPDELGRIHAVIPELIKRSEYHHKSRTQDCEKCGHTYAYPCPMCVTADPESFVRTRSREVLEVNQEKKETGVAWLHINGRILRGSELSDYHRVHGTCSYHCAICGAPVVPGSPCDSMSCRARETVGRPFENTVMPDECPPAEDGPKTCCGGH